MAKQTNKMSLPNDPRILYSMSDEEMCYGSAMYEVFEHEGLEGLQKYLDLQERQGMIWIKEALERVPLGKVIEIKDLIGSLTSSIENIDFVREKLAVASHKEVEDILYQFLFAKLTDNFATTRISEIEKGKKEVHKTLQDWVSYCKKVNAGRVNTANASSSLKWFRAFKYNLIALPIDKFDMVKQTVNELLEVEKNINTWGVNEIASSATQPKAQKEKEISL